VGIHELHSDEIRDEFFPITCSAVLTGMRIGEIVALEWNDVDFERKIIVVRRSYGGRTKSGKVRYVPINSKLLSILEACSKNRKSDLVFPDKDGNMRSIDFRTEMKRAAKKAGIRRIRMHDLRHTFASNYVIKGGNILSLQKILGHSTINMTLRYAHLAPDFMARDVELLDFDIQSSPIRPQREARIC
jgi:integrase